MSDLFWQLLFTALIGITTGAVVPLILQWRSKGAEAAKSKEEAEKTEAERKDIEDRITARVLERAQKEVESLSLKNEDLEKDVRKLEGLIAERVLIRTEEFIAFSLEKDELKKANDKLMDRVQQLEDRCVIMQAEQERVLAKVACLERGIGLLCEQLSDAGMEPVFSIEELDEGD